MHFYAWKKGLKTGMYYLRTRPKADAIQFTVDQASLIDTKNKEAAAASAKLLSNAVATPARSAAASGEKDSPDSIVSSSAGGAPGVTKSKDAASSDQEGTAFSGLDYPSEEVCDSCGA